ncbi:MAG: hypothetical protein K2M79_03115 [Muribaculaceae bacterium]|nr:hypothetical protein [Muribaculaceae bacterium]
MKHTLRVLCVALAGAGAFQSAGAAGYATESRLATGNWVRIKVTQQGINAISYDKLREWGFSDPSRVAVYGYGGVMMLDHNMPETLPDDLNQTATLHLNDRILFYGVGAQKNATSGYSTAKRTMNTFDDGGYYFLSDAENVKSIPSYAYRQYVSTDPKRRTTHTSISAFEEDMVNPSVGGGIFFGASIKEGQDYEIKLPMYDFDPSESRYSYGTLEYAFASFNTQERTPLNLTLPAELTTTSGIRVVQAARITDTKKMYTTGSGSGSIQPSGDRNPGMLTFTFSRAANDKATNVWMDYLSFVYPRANRLTDHSQIMMHFFDLTAGRSNGFEIKEAPYETTEIWSISNETDIHRYELRRSQTSVVGTFESGTQAHIVVFNKTADFPEPAFAGEVKNQNLHALSTPDMVVITTPELLPYAQELAQAHRDHEGLDVLVVTQDEIFNEFSSGTRTPVAYRRMLKMLLQRDPSKLKWLMLYGPTKVDMRANPDRLLTYETDVLQYALSEAQSFASDNYFGMLEDDFDITKVWLQPMTIGVGRVPVRNVGEASVINAKLISYIKNPPSAEFADRGVFISDEGDSFAHITQSEQSVAYMVDSKPGYSPYRATVLIQKHENLNAPLTQRLISTELKRGLGLMVYNGHYAHGASYMGQRRLWSEILVNSTQYKTPVFAVLATCSAYCYDVADVTMAYSLLKADGGAIGVIAADRAVFLNHNQNTAIAAISAYADATEDIALGDVVKIQHNAIRSGESAPATDLAINSMCYNLCGDPAIKLPKPSRKVKLTAINGNAVSDDDQTMTEAYDLAPVTLEGVVTDAAGNVDASFNGTVSINVFDGRQRYKTHSPSAYDRGDYYVDLDQTLLGVLNGTVTDGVFTVKGILPEVHVTGSVNRLSLVARSDSHTGTGGFHGLSIKNGTLRAEDLAAEYPAPEINSFTLNGQDFSNDIVVTNGSVMEIAALVDGGEAGLNVGGGGLTTTVLTLDGSNTQETAGGAYTVQNDGMIHFAYRLPQVTVGRHTVSFRVANNAGQVTELQRSFVVASPTALTTLYMTDHTARDYAIIESTEALDGENTLLIEDAAGRPVLRRTGVSFPYTWNLKNNSGKTVADGCYRVRVLHKNGNILKGSPSLDVVVVK